MDILKNIPIRRKLLLPVLIVIVALVIIMYLAISGLSTQHDSLDRVNDALYERVEKSEQMTSLGLRIESDAYRMAAINLMDIARDELEAVSENMRKNISDLNYEYAEILNRKTLDAGELQILQEMKGPLGEFTFQALQASRLIDKNPSLGVIMVRSASEPFKQFLDLLEDFSEYEHQVILATMDDSTTDMQNTRGFIIIMTITTALLALVLTGIIARYSITKPIRKITVAMGRLVAGDFLVEVGDTDRRDEIGTMAKSLEVFKQNAIEKDIAEKSLTQSESKYRLLFDTMKGGFAYIEVIFDENGIPADYCFLDVNDSFRRITGSKTGQLLGQKVFEARPELKLQYPALIDIFHKVVISGNPMPFEMYNKDLFSWHSISVYRPQPGYLAITIDDITDRKQAEKRDKELATMKEVDELRSELLANVSHELRTPLSSIKGYANMMIDYNDRIDDEEKKQALISIDKATERLVELIDQLLDMSRLESDNFHMDKEKDSIAKLIATAVEECEVRSVRHTFVLKAPRRLPNIIIDQKRIRQVIDNLLDNAVKYSPQNSIITTEIHKKKDWIVVSVSDQGNGIPEEDKTRIFERMYRRKDDINFKVKGVGLGLAIAKHIVEAHDGKIWAESTSGEGSTFYFTLPLNGKVDSAVLSETVSESDIIQESGSEAD